MAQFSRTGAGAASAREHGPSLVRLPEIDEVDGGARRGRRSGGVGRHSARKSFVRKKSETRIEIDAETTVRVVAVPTEAAPPLTFNPL